MCTKAFDLYTCLVVSVEARLRILSRGLLRLSYVQHMSQMPARSVSNDMRKARVVAGALIEGDQEDDDATGNAASVISLVLMLEEVGEA